MNRINQLRTALLIGGILYVVTATAGFNSQANVSTSSNTHFFIENKGQWPDEVRYLASIAGMNAWITNNGVVYDHFITERNYDPAGLVHLPLHERRKAEMENTIRKGHVVKMNLKGSNRNAMSDGANKKSGYYNYFKGNDPEKWASYVPLYGQIEIHEVYEGIKVKYYFDGGLLRYDFHVQPGADLNQIRFSLSGQDALKINEHGELVIETSLGDVTHGRLYAYQFCNGIENEVACRFLQNPDGTIGIVAENFDPTKELVIDPLVFSTYLGGNANESARTVKIGQDGSVIVAGNTGGINFPVTPGAYQTSPLSSNDMFVTKLTSDLSELVFSTYISGNNTDNLQDMALGNGGSVFITGYTYSGNYPVTSNAFQTSIGGWEDAFVTGIHPSGSSLIYSTFLGGSEFDFGGSISVNDNDEAIVMGDTGSRHDFPVTPGSLHSEWGGVFVSKFNSNGTSLIFSATIDNIRSDAMTIDDNGNIYLAGYGNDYNFPITPGAFQEDCPGFGSCAAVVIIDPNATVILYSTFLGGTDSDYATVIKLANNGDIVIGGYTRSTNFPASPDAFQTSHSGFLDVFISRLNPMLTSLAWSTYVGGFSAEMCNDIVLDAYENIYFTGHTQSYNYPVTPGAFQSNGISYTAIISKLKSDGTTMLYSTYLGGIDRDIGNSIDLLQVDEVIIAGSTLSSDFPVSPGVFQGNLQGNSDAFITRLFTINCEITLSISVETHVSCYGGSDGSATAEPAGGHPPYFFLWSDGQTEVTAIALAAGSYTVVITDSYGCTITDSITITEPPVLLSELINSIPASCANSLDGIAVAVASGGTPPYTFAWSNGENGETAGNLPAGNNWLTITDSKGCLNTIEFETDYIRPYAGEVICAVSVDTASGNNIVYWMKTDGVRTTAYNIYREAGASGQYEIVGNTFFTGPSMYEDVPANPSQQSHRYKIAVVDSCQEESALSPYHKTMHLAISSGGNNEINLQWNAYQGFDYTTHFIYRSLDHGAYSLIGQVPSSNMVFTDLAAPSGIKKYFIEIHAPESCGTEMNPLTVHSNIVTYDPTGAGNLLYDKHFRVYPNPGEGFYKIDFTGEADGKPKRIEVINQLGMVIQTHQVPAGENYVEINLHEPNGIYFIRGDCC
jgi:hypothetical protein